MYRWYPHGLEPQTYRLQNSKTLAWLSIEALFNTEITDLSGFPSKYCKPIAIHQRRIQKNSCFTVLPEISGAPNQTPLNAYHFDIKG
jgi:hypothetical protein